MSPDLVIIGAGPAGMTAARIAAEGSRVCVMIVSKSCCSGDS